MIWNGLWTKWYNRPLPSGSFFHILLRREASCLPELAIKGRARSEAGLRIDFVDIAIGLQVDLLNQVVHAIGGQPVAEGGLCLLVDGCG